MDLSMNGLTNEKMAQYYEKRDSYIRISIGSNTQYIFEVTKCCGYSEWVTVYKHMPLSQLYDNIKNQFGGIKPKQLCILDQSGNKIVLPESTEIGVRDFILNNANHFRPIYPMPASVVYRVYYDDGCCHMIEHLSDNSKNEMKNEMNNEMNNNEINNNEMNDDEMNIANNNNYDCSSNIFTMNNNEVNINCVNCILHK
jgi:hypothetical protein